MKFKSLITQNWVAFGAHLFAGVGLIVLYNVWHGAKNANQVLYRYAIAGPTSTCSTILPVEINQCTTNIPLQLPAPVVQMNVIYACIIFFLLTAAAHLFYATDAFGSGVYSASIRDGWNPFRWVEYSITATIMTLVIASVNGTRDLSTLLGLVFVTVAMMFNGLAVESLLRSPLTIPMEDAVTASTISGWLSFFAVWTVIVFNFTYLVKDVNKEWADTPDIDGNPVKVPAWLWYIVIGQIMYYASFGIVQIAQIFSRRKASYTYIDTESAYLWLSLFSKISLAGSVGYGLLYKTKDC